MVYCASPDPFMVLLIRVKSKPMSNSNSLEMDHLEDSPNKFNKGIRNFYPSQSPTFQEALISCSFPSFHLVETSQHWQKHPYKRMLKYKCNKITKATGIKHLQSSCSTSQCKSVESLHKPLISEIRKIYKKEKSIKYLQECFMEVYDQPLFFTMANDISSLLLRTDFRPFPKIKKQTNELMSQTSETSSMQYFH